MSPGQPPKTMWTTSAQERLREEVGNDRASILAAYVAVMENLPGEAEGFMGSASPSRFGSCFVWPHDFTQTNRPWRGWFIVSHAGWPTHLWIYDVFVEWLD